ncbi:MAG: hypothetical protein CMM52_12195 [Rhodospirillaceae bacterium]|nr:hypothetical protein [Rhodospirillaceae bacterium]|tara:strand:+ start:13626 stop:14882 length:1257 start_codon:yes stop_codon:yes gene_type:complete
MASTARQHQDLSSILQSEDSSAWLELAVDPTTPPEVLYFLAENGEVDIRRAVAENSSTPNQADVFLSRDDDVSVRCALARKIVGEGLDHEARSNLWRMGFTILETLLRDKVVGVRKILSEAFCTSHDAPRQIVVGLAGDKASDVAAPILSGSPILTEDDLAAFIQDDAPDWAKSAVASRTDLSPHLCDILISDECPEVMTGLAENLSVNLDEPVLEKMVQKSESVPEIQPALVKRHDLTDNVLVRMAKFVAAPLLSKLCLGRAVDAGVAARMNRAIESRSDQPAERVVSNSLNAEPVSNAGQAGGEAPRHRAKHLFENEKLTDESVAAALDKKNLEFVLAALALRAGLPMPTVERMVRVQSVKTIVALAWKAGFSARFAMDLQRDLAFISPNKVMNARDGIDFPMRTDEMEYQLSLFE